MPPYLTMPLLDRVLIPYQNGEPADFHLVVWYLSGLASAAILAWLLDWARLYVLARVSERISADLRVRTYAHLQRLSLEFFGGKRTGDLISRVSSDTERLCNFLSLNLVDFGTDSLMIFMTAGILLSIQRAAGFGGAVSVSAHRVAGLSSSRPAVARLPATGRRLGGDDQCAGGHDPGHARRQGVCPGRARDRSVPPQQRARLQRQRPRQPLVGVLRAARDALDNRWA